MKGAITISERRWFQGFTTLRTKTCCWNLVWALDFVRVRGDSWTPSIREVRKQHQVIDKHKPCLKFEGFYVIFSQPYKLKRKEFETIQHPRQIYSHHLLNFLLLGNVADVSRFHACAKHSKWEISFRNTMKEKCEVRACVVWKCAWEKQASS